MTFKKSVGFFAVFSLLALSGCFDSSTDREAKYFSKAQAHFDEQNYDKARVELKNVLQINTKNVEARYLLSKVEEKEKNWQKMFGHLYALVEIQPDHADAQLDLGKLFMLSKDLDQALQKAELVLTNAPDHADALTLKSAILLFKGELGEGKALLEKILTIEPGHIDATMLIVKVLGNEKKYPESNKRIDEALALHQDNIRLALMKVQILMAIAEKEQAESVLKSLIVAHADNQTLHYVLAKFYFNDKRFDNAEQVLRKLSQQFPEEIKPNLTLVDFLAKHKGEQVAEETLLGIIKHHPDEFQYRFALLKFYQDQPERQRQVLKQIIIDDKLGQHGLNARNRLAVMAIAVKDIATAKLFVEEVIEEDQRNSEALLLRAGILIEEKDFDAAITDLRTILKDDPDSEKALLFLASAHMKNKQVELAQEALEKVLVVNPKNLIANKDLAKILVIKGDVVAATELLEKAYKLSPGNEQIAVLLIDLYGRQKHWDKAEEITTVLENSTDKKELAYFKIGQIKFQQEQFKNAIAAFNKVLAIKPEAIDALAGLINSHMGLGEVKKVEQLLNKTIKNYPENSGFYLMRGEFFFQQQRLAEAEQDFKKVVQLSPKFLQGYRNLATVYMVQKQVEKALAVYADGIQKYPESIGLLMGNAAINESTGRAEAAIQTYKKVLALSPQNYLALNNMTALKIRNEDDQQMLKNALLLAAPLKSSRAAAFLDTYGWVNYLNGQYDEALVALEDSISKQDNIPEIHYHLAMVYIQKGRTEEARLALQKALADKVDFFGVEKAKTALEKLNNS